MAFHMPGSTRNEPQRPTPSPLHTDRLLLRHWREDDAAALAALNSDPEVMEYFPTPLSREQSDAMLDRLRAHLENYGFGFWALERRDTGQFIGFAGLAHVGFSAPFTPAVEIGWRLVRSVWGNGYATEAAVRAVEYGFQELALSQLVSFTVPSNIRSRRVMERLAFTWSPTDSFDHPALPIGHPLRRHVLYRRLASRATF